MMAERIHQPDCVRGAISDGFPRTIAQAEWLNRYLQGRTSEGIAWDRTPPIVIQMNVEEDDSFVAWLDVGYVLLAEESIMSGSSLPARYHVCTFDRTMLITNRDDAAYLIRGRLKIYKQEALPSRSTIVRKLDCVRLTAIVPWSSVAAETLAIVRSRDRP
jgi:adenylate kinase